MTIDLKPKVLPPEINPEMGPTLTGVNVQDVPGVPVSNGGVPSGTPREQGGVPDVPKPCASERPCYRVFDQWTDCGGNKFRPGVWYFGTKESAGNVVEVEFWVCGPLHVEAITRDSQSNNFGRLLRFRPTIGPWRQWAMPMELLAGDARELRAELLSMGLEIDPKAKNSLPLYLQTTAPKQVMHCATQVGWCERSFVLPDQVIGQDAARVVFQSGEHQAGEYTQFGTLAAWRDSVAAMATGNRLLTLVLSAGFSGPLLSLCHAESGGLHLVGDSSTGKTAAIEAACSIWGGASYKRSWRATSNGMEGAAAMFNDCLLALDEISECDPREVGAIIYALGNGQGKQRASRTGSARSITRWRCMVLSNGERTISTAMREGGQRAKAGQGVRLLDVPVDRSHGAWDSLHGYTDGAAFSDALKTAAKTSYGHAGPAFLERLTRDDRDFCALLETIKQLPGFLSEDGQHKRGAARLALIAMAGELATDYGITGWEEGDAIAAAVEALNLWKNLRGSGPDERQQTLRQVSQFIDRHGDGRFSDVEGEHQVRDRAGWWRDDDGDRVYLFNADGIREALGGFDFKRALDHLQEAGALIDCGQAERAKPHRIGGRRVRLYSIDPGRLGVDHGA